MKRVLLGSVLFAAVSLAGCRDNPLESDGEVAKIVASPARIFISQGASENVVVQALDAQGNPLPDEITISTAPGAGVTVVQDASLRPTYAPDGTLVPLPQGTVTRFIVTASEFVKTSFTVTAGGVSLEIPIEVVPATLPATLSKTDLMWGDTITITAPAGTFFRDTSRVTFQSGINPIIVSRAADGSSIRLIPGPNSRGPATVTSVGITSNPDLFFTVPTVAEVTSPSLADLGNALSTRTPTLGQTITITAPTGVKFFPTASVYFLSPTDIARNIVISADSSRISFTAPPNRVGAVTVTQVAPGALPQPSFRQTLTTADTIRTAVVTSVPGAVSNSAPAANEPVTFTPTAPIKVARTSVIQVGGVTATTISATADSSSLVFVPVPGSTGPVRITNAVAGGFPMAENLPTGITTFATALPAVQIGTADAASAPLIPMPTAVGGVTVLYDKVIGVNTSTCLGAGAQYYRVTPTTTGSYRVSMDWQGASGSAPDIDLHWRLGDNSGNVAGQTSAATLAKPEVSTVTLTGGTTYLIRTENCGPQVPTWIGLVITRMS